MDSSQLSDLVVRLTESAMQNHVALHQKHMIRLMANLVRFDGAWWGWSTFSGGRIKITNSQRFNMPANFVARWQEAAHDDPLVRQGRRSLHYASALSARGLNQGVFRDFLGDFGIASILNGHWRLKHSGYHFFMSLYRFGQGEFSSHETADFHVVLRHLEQCLSLSQMHSLLRRGSNLEEWALVDAEGRVVQASDSFFPIVALELSGAGRSVSTDRLLARVARERQLWTGQRIALMVEPVAEDMVLLRVTERSGWNLLSRRERQVAELFANGLTHREIAALQRVSPNTVRNQVVSIYRKLSVRRKSELVKALGQA